MRRLALVLLFFVAVAAQAQLVVPRSSAPVILIPAAGSLQGANGTFFRSDLTLLNYRASAQRVQLQWMPQNVAGGTIAPVVITIPAQSGINSEDFVAAVLNQSGIGAILITALMAQGTATDGNAQLFATSRIWTPQPNAATGTNSQQFNGIPVSDINSGTLAILGQRRDSRYRTNVGIVNLSGQTQTFRIDTLTSAGIEQQTIDVPAMSFNQTSLPGAETTLPLQILVTNISASNRTTQFQAYASSVDNVTGDAWSSLGFNPPAPAP
jgi:hypothetical protein